MMDTSDQDAHPPSEESPADQVPEPTEWLWPAYPSDLEARAAARKAATPESGDDPAAAEVEAEPVAEEVEASDPDLVEAVEEPRATEEPVVEEAASEAVAVLLGRVAEDEPTVVGPAAEDAAAEELATPARPALVVRLEPEPEAPAEPPSPPPEEVGWLEPTVPVAEPAAASEPEPVAAEQEPEPAAAVPESAAAEQEAAPEEEAAAAEQEAVAQEQEPVAAEAEPAAEEQEPERAEHEQEAVAPEPSTAEPEPAAAEPQPAAQQQEPQPAAREQEPEAPEPEPAARQEDAAAEAELGVQEAGPAAPQVDEQPEAATSEPVAPETEPAPPEPGTPEPTGPEPGPTTPGPITPEPAPAPSEPAPTGPEPGPPEPGPPEPGPPEPATPEPEPGVPEPAATAPEPAGLAEPVEAVPEPAEPEPEPEPAEPVETLAPEWTEWVEPSGWGRPASPTPGWGAPTDSVEAPEAPETVESDWTGATGWVRPAPPERMPTEPALPEWDEPLEVEWVEAEVVDPGPVPADPIPGDPFPTDLFPGDPAGGEVATTVRPGGLPLPMPLAPPVPRDAVTPAPLAPSPPYRPVPRELGWTLPAPAPEPTWGQPTARPGRRRQGWIVALVLLVVAALLAAGLVWLVPNLRTAGVLNPASGGALSSAARSVGATSARADPATAVKPVLAARARAVLRHDRAAFLATIDQRRTTFYRAQVALFDRMITVPFSDLAYQVAAPARDLSNARVRRSYAPSQVYLSEVEASYRFRGQDSEPATSRYYYTFTLTSAGWRLAGQGDLPAPRTGDVEIWDASPVRSLATARALVVYHPGDRALAQRLLNTAEKGFGQVDASWPEWDHKVVILVPRDQAEAERLLHGRDLSDTAAVSASHVEAGPLRRVLGNRVIVNTTFMKGYSTLAVQLVMTHEMTHVATRNVGLGVPLFLVEGLADYTAWRPVDLPPRVTRQALAVTVRDGTFDGRLPTDNDIVGPNGALAYDKASSFCLWVSRTYGQAKLQRLYGSFSSFRERATAREVDEQMRRTLGISLATAQSRWAAFVRQVM